MTIAGVVGVGDRIVQPYWRWLGWPRDGGVIGAVAVAAAGEPLVDHRFRHRRLVRASRRPR